MVSSLCRNYSIGRGSPWWASLIQDLKDEESQLVTFIILFVEILEQTSFGMYLYVKEL